MEGTCKLTNLSIQQPKRSHGFVLISSHNYMGCQPNLTGSKLPAVWILTSNYLTVEARMRSRYLGINIGLSRAPPKLSLSLSLSLSLWDST